MSLFTLQTAVLIVGPCIVYKLNADFTLSYKVKILRDPIHNVWGIRYVHIDSIGQDKKKIDRLNYTVVVGIDRC